MAENRDFFYRRLHSLLGVIPIGVFLIQHLLVNHFAVYGRESFEQAAGFIHDLPFRIVLEFVVIYIPILFHAILGVYIVFTVKYNNRRYSFFRNIMFTLQRVSGIITLIFIAWHVWETRIAIGLGNAELNYSLMENILTQPFMFWFYIIGVVSTTFHFANGLWSFLVTWGFTITPRSQRVATYATLVVFLIVTYIGVRAIFAFAYGA
ncbi:MULTISPECIES: succinate dehydrogenase cytochrome b558 subunit [Sediminibacillus]|uniref:Succinate dehydrogenase / fumarate reductase cytochrome b subunit n=2 Tax=Sediminibacillus TaxID=482460 RepID=A0A1G9XLK9_9BACI|nr:MULTISPECIES: succinate dehydrogenase cytochrome b558 subunit [Sediminibacillus]QTN00006.1 succinate dehydrogenase [Sediminibacillus dalangtanensis]SDM97133.1 succinate dehydrogenase / fumarate reductase cytochrome b subunit [Sediminibacillus halophilus]